MSLNPFVSKASFPRGIHPPENKEMASGAEIEIIPTPAQVQVPLHQHSGAPCEALVKPRSEVVLGQAIGRSEAFVSAAVHSPVNGKVARTSMVTLPNGRHVEAVAIKAEGEQLEGEALWQALYGGDWPPGDADEHSPEEILEAVKNAGIVGLGGAAFPTHVKLKLAPDRPVHTLVLNGCECEPFLNADYRLMLEAAAAIVSGARLAARAVGAKRIVVAIEDNKPLAVDEMRSAAARTAMEIVVVKTKYPMGSERQLVPTILGLEVPTGGIPLEVGVLVMNVGTAAAVAAAVFRGHALTHRVVTVSGPGIRDPKNLLVPLGISYRELVEFCGGLREDAARVIAGGPMMGFTLGNLDSPVTKGTSGITVLTEAEVRRSERIVCIRCGRCVDVCPLHLVPTKIAHAARKRDWDLSRRYYISACVECGCCAFACPSSIPLVQMIRAGKAEIPRT